MRVPSRRAIIGNYAIGIGNTRHWPETFPAVTSAQTFAVCAASQAQEVGAVHVEKHFSGI